MSEKMGAEELERWLAHIDAWCELGTEPKLRAHISTLQREADGMREADEVKYDALMQIAQWCDAYPQDVFEPLPADAVKRADKVLAAAGISIGALHAGWSRHLLDGVGRIARAALNGSPHSHSLKATAAKVSYV